MMQTSNKAASLFQLSSLFSPCGDQPQAIAHLTEGVVEKVGSQVLLGVTGSGKTFTMANVIARLGRPTLVISHNKTLAAQLASEFKLFFPHNAVEYFVSYYDYYQPEAYIPYTDTYIEKDAAINAQIDRLRHSATHSVLTRCDTIVVASVSCIYGLGSPDDYADLRVVLETGVPYDRDTLLRDLVALCYERNDIAFERGRFRVRGDVVDIFPAYEEQEALRISFFGDEIDSIDTVEPISGKRTGSVKRAIVFPASHYAIPKAKLERAIGTIEEELDNRLRFFINAGKHLEYHRLHTKTRYDIEMMREMGYCQGIENYSRHFSGRTPGEPPYTLLDYFPEDMLILIDESHVTVPQLRAMYEGDRVRKANLVEHGFRLPSACDNRPLKFAEFEERLSDCMYISATPGPYERKQADRVVEQIIRPTGLMDPEPVVRSVEGQVDDLVAEISQQVARGERTLVTTLTKRMSEDLSKYLKELGIKVNYLHSDIKTLARLKVLKELRQGLYDVLVGVNLLREGLDLPEVSLVAILDADKEGFLRNETSLIQTMGRAARNAHGRVILYADTQTKSLTRAITETLRRREIQAAYNTKHGIIPQSIRKHIVDLVDTSDVAIAYAPQAPAQDKVLEQVLYQEDTSALIVELEEEMRMAANNLEFEQAAILRDQIKTIKSKTT